MEKNIITETPKEEKKILDFSSFKKDNNIFLKEKNDYYTLKYFKDNNDFLELRDLNKFIKATEKVIRNSYEYTDYISFLRQQYDMNSCMILENANSKEDEITIEMHHGPILTLYDYCNILFNHMVITKQKINTFRLARLVLLEHFNNNVQIIMLSKSVHELVHSGKIFIHVDQAFGNLNRFINKYEEAIDDIYYENINNYLELCKKYKTTDNGLLKVNDFENWNNIKIIKIEDIKNIVNKEDI